MKIGIPKEVKDQEYRVSASPSSVQEFVARGHRVFVEKNAGIGIGKSDEDYKKAGAMICETADEVWACDMVFKVKEPVASEYHYLREGLIVFSYLHLAAERALVEELVKSGTTAIAFETVEVGGKLPLLTPMSEVGGCMSIQEGAFLLTKSGGGKGKLLQGLPGVPPAHVVIVGGGVAGTGAIRTAVGIGARVTVLDINVDRLAQLSDIYGSRLETLYSNAYNIAKVVKTADLLVGAVLLHGAKAPKIVTEEMVKSMDAGSVIVDIAIDQGGCVETIDHATTHTDPTYVRHDVVHYAVANIPGTVSRAATYALSNVTTAYAMEIADKGWLRAAKENPAIEKGINIADHKIVYKAVADAFDMASTDIKELYQ